MKKMRMSTMNTVIRDGYAEVGKYLYHLFDGMAGHSTIKRCHLAELNTIPRYGDKWEVVAVYSPAAGCWQNPV